MVSVSPRVPGARPWKSSDESTLMRATRSSAEIVAAAWETSSGDGGGAVVAHEPTASVNRTAKSVLLFIVCRGRTKKPDIQRRAQRLGDLWSERIIRCERSLHKRLPDLLGRRNLTRLPGLEPHSLPSLNRPAAANVAAVAVPRSCNDLP